LAGVIDFTDEEIQMSNQIMGYWTQFARTGDPNGSARLAWPRYDTLQPYLALNLTITAAQGPKAAACAFWKGLHLY
jgi:para-nitrobenzyl esterase